MPKVKCHFCAAKIDEEKMPDHLFRCALGKPFTCTVGCGKRFVTATGVTAHEAKFHTAEERNSKFKCSYCEQGFNDQRTRINHESRHLQAGGDGFRRRSRSRGTTEAAAEGNQNVENNNNNTRAYRQQQAMGMDGDVKGKECHVARGSQWARDHLEAALGLQQLAGPSHSRGGQPIQIPEGTREESDALFRQMRSDYLQLKRMCAYMESRMREYEARFGRSQDSDEEE